MKYAIHKSSNKHNHALPQIRKIYDLIDSINVSLFLIQGSLTLLFDVQAKRAWKYASSICLVHYMPLTKPSAH